MVGSFDEFMVRRLAASTAFVNGDIAPLEQISAHVWPATIFGPSGDVIQGADNVNAVNARGAAMFTPGATNDFEVVHQSADEHLAYWVGIQSTTVHLQGQDRPICMNLRVTEIFSRQEGQWTLIHRHADHLAESSLSRH